MAGASLDLGKTISLASLFSREPSLGPVLPFSPQTTALCVPRSPSVENRLEQLVAKMDVATIEKVVGYQWREKSFPAAGLHPPELLIQQGDRELREAGAAGGRRDGLPGHLLRLLLHQGRPRTAH